MLDVLDCTFRDGGYYTSWDFEEKLIDTYLECVSRLPISNIELGYVNEDLPGYFGEFFYLRSERLKAARQVLRSDQKLFVMQDGKSGKPERLEHLFGPLVGIVDGVRLTASPDALDHALDLARELKRIGMQVGLNIMYLSSYIDDLSRLKVVLDEDRKSVV